MESCGGGVDGEARKRGRFKDGEGEEEPPAAKRGRIPSTSALAAWAPHPASRIYRVSRASGGKDRHSKVYTAKGIRDRRVRLSVATAIQFYDLQDRLGYDQPSKAIEWLIKAAADAIDKLPELHNNFPPHPASSLPSAAAAAVANEKEKDKETAEQGSGCSSTSETSKGSVLSLSRNESRVKARERARERRSAAATKDDAPRRAAHPPPGTTTTTTASSSSFTELLTGMSSAADQQHKHPPPASSWTAAEYIGFAQPPPPRKSPSSLPQAFASPAPHLGVMTPAAQQHFGFSAAGAVTIASGAGGGEPPHAEMPQHFSFLQGDHHHHFMPSAAAAGGGGDYNLNFSMAPGGGGGGLVMGVNGSRGTLQSNSPHISISSAHQQQQQQLSSTTATPLDAAAPNIVQPFLFTPAADTQFAAAFQLWNGFQHHQHHAAAADIKEKGKN
ncbi:hypothetical protein PR202_ga28357 [Eleusine coracana subsp. coracana]|uniref:Uncharacterized protein n=1 Tax=Eleusine coracana subsp. coracana TaxID=191504 RepID=A0AAV5DIC5_ELECO|nr:hypothetical protein QOZ80_7AG0555740 [Eleusine coracana subsp. coracana]GJN10278.1 hypothetical protein PR202_ga28357 [Eleusine coracana subsp. coracana]